jgi:hypothetical protein
MTSTRARALVVASAGLWIGALAVRIDSAKAASMPLPTAAPSTVSATLPDRLSETGLYSDPVALTVDPRNRPFTPQYPLWSDGAEKHRWVRLPDGASIDGHDIDAWDFPLGTRFWKEFVFKGVRVETRHFVKVARDRWTLASYQWSADQRDATRAPVDGVPAVAEVAPGKWHNIPSEAECRACHDSGRTEVLGFSALQLSDDRDPLAPHAEPVVPGMVTLHTLVDEGRISGIDRAHLAAPPRIAASDPTERAVLGYLSANCGSCHNRQSTIASLGLFLKYSLATTGTCAPDAVATTVGRPGHWVVPSAPEGESRLVAPGRSDLSALLRRTQSRRPSSQMPPIGTVVADADALLLVQRWIQALKSRPSACATSFEATAR